MKRRGSVVSRLRPVALPGVAILAGCVVAGLALFRGPIDLGRPTAPLPSIPPGLFSDPISLQLKTGEPHSAIHYTTDGTPPVRSPHTRYIPPIEIASTTVIRSASIRPWIADSRVSTSSYIFPAHVALQGAHPDGLPESWRGRFLQVWERSVVDADYAMDPNAVADLTEFAPALEQALRALPTVSLVMDPADLFDEERGIYVNATQEGTAWERPVSMEFFESDGLRLFQIDAGLRINGLSARRLNRNPKQGFRILFRRSYGATALHTKLFERDAHVGFEALVLRNLTQDTWATRGESGLAPAHYIRDQFSRETQAAMGHPALEGIFVHLYLNGLYWGIYSLCERPDGSFMSRHFGGSPLQYDIIKGLEAQAGTRAAWDQVEHLSRAINDQASYRMIETLVDIDNFIDYVLINQFTDNIDWHAGNALLARKREPGGRFIFLIYDAEITFGSRHSNIDFLDLGLVARKSRFFSPLHLFHRLQGHPEFKLRVADRIQRNYFNGGALGVEESRQRWLRLAEHIHPAMVAESARWGDSNIDGITRTREGHWRPAIDQVANEYFPDRTAMLLKHYRNEGFISAVTAPEYTVTDDINGAGVSISLRPTEAEIFYTLDGADPRLSGGALNGESAQLFGDAITLSPGTTLRARARDGVAWSALIEVHAPTGSPD